MSYLFRVLPAVVLALSLPAPLGCASSGSHGAATTQKSGFVVIERDGRLYVFDAGSEALADYRASGDMAKRVTRIGAGPNGETLIAPDTDVLDRYTKG